MTGLRTKEVDVEQNEDHDISLWSRGVWRTQAIHNVGIPRYGESLLAPKRKTSLAATVTASDERLKYFHPGNLIHDASQAQ
jgi:hypothetical protein